MQELSKKQQWLLQNVESGDTDAALKLVYTMTLRELGEFTNWVDEQDREIDWCAVLWCSSLEVSASFEITWASELLKPEAERDPDFDCPDADELSWDDPISGHTTFLPQDFCEGVSQFGGGA